MTISRLLAEQKAINVRQRPVAPVVEVHPPVSHPLPRAQSPIEFVENDHFFVELHTKVTEPLEASIHKNIESITNLQKLNKTKQNQQNIAMFQARNVALQNVIRYIEATKYSTITTVREFGQHKLTDEYKDTCKRLIELEFQDQLENNPAVNHGDHWGKKIAQKFLSVLRFILPKKILSITFLANTEKPPETVTIQNGLSSILSSPRGG